VSDSLADIRSHYFSDTRLAVYCFIISY